MWLDSLPVELLQDVARHLNDKDLASLRATCCTTAAAIDARPAHFWMYRFKETYDMPRIPHTLDGLKKLYQERRRAVRSLPLFSSGDTRVENNSLKHIMAIALDATPSTDNEYGIPISKNLQVLDHIAKTSNILQCILEKVTSPPPSSPGPTHSRRTPNSRLRSVPALVKNNIMGLQAIQLLLSSRSLSFHVPSPIVWSFNVSQREAYMDFASTPLFSGYGGLEVNMLWALHVVNFFRYHMLRDCEATLCPAFRDLSAACEGMEMPQLWKKQLKTDDDCIDLGKHWKGSYAYLSRREVNEIRRGVKLGEKSYDDHNVDLGHKAIQVMEMKFPKVHEAEMIWPSIFEHHLTGKDFIQHAVNKIGQVPSPRTRSSSQVISTFEGLENMKSSYYEAEGWDDEVFFSTGWINQLPAQKGIPGFKRMTMMKYFKDQNDNIDFDALWAYEGIVLPGDQIIVGRWWSPEDPIRLDKIYSGPFILWNTDCAAKYKEVHDSVDLSIG